jgi:hypothetical protein
VTTTVGAHASPGLAADLSSATAASAMRFERALADPERAQRERLAAILRAAAGGRRARDIRGLARVRNAREFQDALPLCTADDLARDVERIAQGTLTVLTRDPVLWLQRSGGSSGAPKQIPYTSGLLREFHAALSPWVFDLVRGRPKAWSGPGYWSVSPIGQPNETTPSGIAVGGAEDGAYFPAGITKLLARGFAVPGEIAGLPDVESCRYVTLRLLIERPDLAFAGAWNPSFLTLMMQALDHHAERLLDDLAAGVCRPPDLAPAKASGDARAASRAGQILAVLGRMSFRADPQRARQLRARLARDGRIEAAVLWPELALISVWTDAQAGSALPPLCERFAGVEIQGKGLLASEGVVSIPWLAAPAPVLAVRSHFMEFIDVANPAARPRLAHELEPGASYEVVISTGAGFLRYRLGDRVRVEGRFARTPCVRFEGRADVSDLVGEKLSASHTTAVLSRVIERAGETVAPRFVMLAPEWGSPPSYHLYVESAAGDDVLDEWSRRIEEALLDGFPYRYARELGQLGPVEAIRVDDAERRYEAGCVARGQRAGDVKPPGLELRTGWGEWLAGRAVGRRTQ